MHDVEACCVERRLSAGQRRSAYEQRKPDEGERPHDDARDEHDRGEYVAESADDDARADPAAPEHTVRDPTGRDHSDHRAAAEAD